MITDWLGVASALIAAIGLVFAGRQFMVTNNQAREERLLGLRGVVVYWRPESAPAAPDDDGSAVWRYVVTVANPGRFPIDNVHVDWHFLCDVQRWRGSAGAFEPPSRTLQLSVPVLPGGGEHTWKRTLRMDFNEASSTLPGTFAKVSFSDIGGDPRENWWPRSARPAKDHVY